VAAAPARPRDEQRAVNSSERHSRRSREKFLGRAASGFYSEALGEQQPAASSAQFRPAVHDVAARAASLSSHQLRCWSNDEARRTGPPGQCRSTLVWTFPAVLGAGCWGALSPPSHAAAGCANGRRAHAHARPYSPHASARTRHGSIVNVCDGLRGRPHASSIVTHRTAIAMVSDWLCWR
jgi:hypothetical protein